MKKQQKLTVKPPEIKSMPKSYIPEEYFAGFDVRQEEIDDFKEIIKILWNELSKFISKEQLQQLKRQITQGRRRR